MVNEITERLFGEIQMGRGMGAVDGFAIPHRAKSAIATWKPPHRLFHLASS